MNKKKGVNIELIEFGNKLKFARKKIDLSQDELAECVGIARDTLSRYERGLLEPGIITVKSLAVQLDVPVGWLLFENESEAISYIKDKKIEAVANLNKAMGIFLNGDKPYDIYS